MLAGHSMGAHTLTALALANPERVAAIVVDRARSSSAARSTAGDAAPTGTRSPTGSSAAASRASSRPTTTTSIPSGARRCCGSRASGSSATAIPRRSPQALREVPRSRPFDDLAELEFLDVPALVVASHDEADPGHPYAVAEAWADAAAAGDPDQRGAGRVAARLAGRAALARDRRASARRPRSRRSGSARLSAGGRAAGRRGAGPTRSRRSRRPCCRPGRRERELADDVLGDVGLDARGALRPGDPEAAVGVDRARERAAAALELGARVKKATTTSSGADGAAS